MPSERVLSLSRQERLAWLQTRSITGHKSLSLSLQGTRDSLWALGNPLNVSLTQLTIWWSSGYAYLRFSNFLSLRSILKILFIFREKRRKGEGEGEKHWWEKETLIGCLSYAHQPTQACALARNQISDLLFCRTTFNQLSHTSQSPCDPL